MIAFKRTPSESAGNPQLFEPGQLVRHRRYDYRGVVVARDMTCQADDDWYDKNQTQPLRNQPWYHVLVDQADACTYAASENLIADSSGLPVQHPLVPHFFSDFKEGVYLRNDQPWAE
jgi:heat shock protein HspQ